MRTHKKIKDLVCPFYSLHCDDIQVTMNGNQFKVNNKNLICAKKIEKSNIKNSSQILPEINSKISTLSDALKAIKKNLSDHKEILLLNHGVDLSGLRSMLSFSTKYNCIIDHINSKTLFQNLNQKIYKQTIFVSGQCTYHSKLSFEDYLEVYSKANLQIPLKF